MSERNHSAEEIPQETNIVAEKTRKSVMPYVAGTGLLIVMAGVWLQFFQANPAASQTGAPAGTATLNAPTNQVLAKVNNQSITYDVVARQCVELHGEEILESLINRLIIQQQCDQNGVTVTKAEVEQEVAATAKKFNLPLDTWYTMLEGERGLNPEQYHQDIIWPMLALKKLAGQNITVSEQDMKIGFERDYGPRVKARMILVNGNHRQAAEIWEKCTAAPDDFDRLAREFSADPNTRPLGGVIPPIRKHGNPDQEQIETTAFKMRVGEISGLIQVAESRYVILKCEGFTEPVVDDIRTVWGELRNQLQEEKTQTAVAKVFEKIKSDARVDNFLTRTSTGTSGPSSIQRASGTAAPNAVQTAAP